MKVVFCILLILCFASNVVFSQQTDTINIYYKLNESSIQKINFCKLDSIAKVLKDSDSIKVAIYGFSDHSGTDEYNLNLTNTRAKKVETYLLNREVYLHTISFCMGKGKVQSKIPNDKLLYEPLHRKVELILIKPQPLSKKAEPIQIHPAPHLDNKTTSTNSNLAEPSNLVTQMGNMKIGESLVLKNIIFSFNTCYILEESKDALKELLMDLLESPGLKIEIQGHTDSTPSHYDPGIGLSIERAKAIYSFLVRNGIDSSRLQYVGFGGSKPLVKAFSLENRKKIEGLK